MKIILYMILLSGFLMLAGCSERKSQSPDFYSEIRSANKIVLSEMRVTKMATVRDRDFDRAETVGDRAAAFINSFKVGQRVAVYSYDTYLQSYMDMSELTPADVVVDERNRTVTVTLPEIRTGLAGRDGTLREEHYRVTGMRSDIKPQERAMLKEKMNSQLKREIESGSFKELSSQSARRKALDYFTALISSSGYRPVITISNSERVNHYEGETKF